MVSATSDLLFKLSHKFWIQDDQNIQTAVILVLNWHSCGGCVICPCGDEKEDDSEL